YLAMVFTGLAFGVLVAPLGLLYNDVGRAINILAQFLMYLTPVVYPLANEGWLAWITRLNPATYVLETARATLVGGPFPYIGETCAVLAVILILLFLGWTTLRITLPRIIERLG